MATTEHNPPKSLISWRRLGWGALGLVLLGGQVAGQEQRSNYDWPAFLGPTNDGKSAERGIRKDWKQGLPILWQMPLDESYAGPSISRGKLYIADRSGDQIRLYCKNAANGADLWSFQYPTLYLDKYGYNGGPRCCPVVDEERVYLYGPEGMLHCLGAEKGELIWKVDTVKEFGVLQNFFGVGSTPCVVENLLIVHVGGSPANSPELGAGDVKGNDSAVVAFDKKTGKIRYRFSDELASYSSPIVREVQGKRRGYLFTRGGLLGFDPLLGKELFFFPWRAPILESVNAANPVMVGSEIFISEAYDVKQGGCLLDVKDDVPRVVWRDAPRKNSMQAHFSTPIYHEGYLYGCSSRHSSQAELRCVEWKTGKVLWSEPNLYWTQLLYVDDHFILLSEDGVLRLIRATPAAYELVSEWIPSEGSGLLAKRLLTKPAWAAPVLAQGLLYLRGNHRLISVKLAEDESHGSAP